MKWQCKKCGHVNVGTGLTYPTHCDDCGVYWEHNATWLEGSWNGMVPIGVCRNAEEEKKLLHRQYLKNRFYIRGLSPLGIFNTLTACLFNRVLVVHKDSETGKRVGWHVGRGTEFPPRRSDNSHSL